MIERGDIYWVEFDDAGPNQPAFRRPIVVVQSDVFNRSAIGSVIVAPLTSNLERAKAPGNVMLSAAESGLPKDSVVVVSQLVTVGKSQLADRVGSLPAHALFLVDNGLRLVLDL